MNPVRKKRLLWVVFISSVVAVALALILYALSQNINLFYTPTQMAAGEVKGKQTIRLGGMVVKGSIIRSNKDLSVQFDLTDLNKTVTVTYRGTLPDLFREGQGIVALGDVIDSQHFKAMDVLAKHDANYMPPEVKDALAKSSKLRSGKVL
jgi:cytochrome c-type biogenesis protein CcmE